ncbi:MAG: hypothetical protein JRI68_36175 [Deltaproteobacteria bacterium]|nr:hypothetical protein [Deltaproteobacteria bacterium]
MATPDDEAKSPAKRTLARRLLLGLIVVAGMVLVLGIVFVAVNLVDEEPGPPVYTEADLPPVPPAEENGWAMLRDTPLHSGTRVDTALTIVVPGALAELSLAEFSAQRVAADEELTEALQSCAQAFEAPRFADGCPMSFEVECPGLIFHQCQRLRAYQILDLAAQGSGGEAVAMAGQLLDATIDHAQTARGLLGQAIALSNLEATLALVGALDRWLPEEEMVPLLTQLRTFDPDSLRPELALVGEYLLVLNAIEMVRSSGAEDRSTWLLDEGATRKIFDDAYRSAADGSAFVLPAQREGLLWWFDNAAGKLIIDGLHLVDTAWQSVQDRERRIHDQRDALLRLHPVPD